MTTISDLPQLADLVKSWRDRVFAVGSRPVASYDDRPQRRAELEILRNVSTEMNLLVAMINETVAKDNVADSKRVQCRCGKWFTLDDFDQHMHLNNGQGGRHGYPPMVPEEI